MDFAFSEEQEELRRYVRQWLDEKSGSGMVRELMASVEGNSAAQWKEIAELGWQSMAIPETYGGAGFGFLELAVVLEEQGRALFTAPFFSTVVLAANAILAAGTEEQKQSYLPRIAAGELTATVAASDIDGSLTRETRVTAARDGDAWVLDGVKRFVLDGHTSDLVIVTANASDGLAAFLVDGTQLITTPLDVMDETRKLAEVALSGVRVEDSNRMSGDVSAMLVELEALAITALSIESVGGTQQCLDMAVEYSKDRQQFGRPIGSFQAIKHKCADMLVQAESARSAAYYAAWAVSEQSPDVAEAAGIAKSFCNDAFFHCASENIQIHGGIGFTWEHDAHLYFKRAKSSQMLFGSSQEHRRRLAETIGI